MYCLEAATSQTVMNAKLSQLGFWSCHGTGSSRPLQRYSTTYFGSKADSRFLLAGHWNSLYEPVFNLFWLSLAFIDWRIFEQFSGAFGWLPGTLYTWYKIVCNFIIGEYLSFYIQMFLQHHQEHLHFWGLLNWFLHRKSLFYRSFFYLPRSGKVM